VHCFRVACQGLCLLSLDVCLCACKRLWPTAMALHQSRCARADTCGRWRIGIAAMHCCQRAVAVTVSLLKRLHGGCFSYKTAVLRFKKCHRRLGPEVVSKFKALGTVAIVFRAGTTGVVTPRNMCKMQNAPRADLRSMGPGCWCGMVFVCVTCIAAINSWPFKFWNGCF
jgi:hypothetical protein